VVLVQGDHLDFALAEKMDWSEVERPAFEVSRTLIKEVSRTGRSACLCLADLPDDHPASHSLLDRGVCAVACVPMAGPRGTIGVLYLDRRSPPGSFGAETRWLLDLFAGQAAAALENARARREKARALEAARELNRRQRAESEHRARYGALVGTSEVMQELYRRLDLIAPTEMPVLILGETGTGKELVARIIHDRGPRKDGAFVAINCAGLAETLLESELFGHERGAFTGADRARPGLFEAAHGGTLFLDEVGDMSPRMQGELLRALQSGEVRRVGGRETIHVDARVIAATHRDLEARMRRDEFRQDLYYRLNVLILRLPPLRGHVEDIPLLAAEILATLAPGGAPPRISGAALKRLMAYAWPGNVRELINVLRRLQVLGLSEIEEAHLPEEILRAGRAPARDGSLREAEAEAIRRALESAGGNKTEAARILGMHRKTLHLKLKQMGPP
jgi:transcriptional regulator with GAF, ATPase, and Fis domain